MSDFNENSLFSFRSKFIYLKKKINLLLNLNKTGEPYSGAFIPIISIASTTLKQISMVYSYPSMS